MQYESAVKYYCPMDLNKKIEDSIRIIRKMEKMAFKYSPDGFHVAFSGGKDSQVIYELAKMAGVKFKAYFYKTSVDPPELLRFIRSHYPDVIWLKPEKTMFQMILQKKMLPLRNRRYCCEYLKERRGLNEVVIIGIRKEKSTRRKKRKVFTNDCKLGCDKPLLSPILDWTESDVFGFLSSRNIQVCDLYKKVHRIGCIGCPMNCKSQRNGLRMFPMFRRAYINTIEKLRILYGKYMEFESAEDAFNWWCSGISKKKYLANKKQLKFPWWDEMI